MAVDENALFSISMPSLAVKDEGYSCSCILLHAMIHMIVFVICAVTLWVRLRELCMGHERLHSKGVCRTVFSANQGHYIKKNGVATILG